MMTRDEMLQHLTNSYNSYTESWTADAREDYNLEDDIQNMWDERRQLCPTWETDTYADSRTAGVYLGHISQDDYPLHGDS